MKTIRPAFKIHGGKFYTNKWIIKHFPENYTQYDYIEPYFGAGSVFFNKESVVEGKIQVVNDIHPRVVAIFNALREEPKEFIKRIKSIRYSERVFNRELKRKKFKDYMDEAVNEFVLRRMSRDGLKKAFAWSERLRGGKPGDVNAWQTIKETLPIVSKKLQNVIILNRPALKVISAFDSPNTLCYCDPPYMHETRVSTDAYEYEMSLEDHEAMLNQLKKFSGKVIISGYMCSLYASVLKEWRKVIKKTPNHSSQQKIKSIKTECLWLNYDK
jgi:DNA adenine methylase